MNATGWIKVVRSPAGSAPEWVRRAWVGLILPCCPILGFPENGEPEKDVTTGKPVKYDGVNREGVSVPQIKALELLAKKDLQAAFWWRTHGFPKPAPDDHFSFGADEIEIVSGVEQQKIVQHLGILELGR